MRFARFGRLIAVIAIGLAVSACASSDDAPVAATPGDPYEQTNRAIHGFNVALDRNVLRPVAQGYDIVAVGPVKLIISNGLNHLELPIDFANHLLQGEMTPAARTLGRFVVNTVYGAAGLLDPATEFGLPREQNDFGITLGKYGVEPGPYLVLPFLGPSTARDLGGSVVDRAFSPTTYFGFSDVEAVSGAPLPINVLDPVDARSQNFDLVDELLYESADSYVTLRSVYLQRRAAQIGGEDETLPDIFDEETTQ
ncbi:MAG: VacJ family lipoprotein [Pseudomonadota bacterium]